MTKNPANQKEWYVIYTRSRAEKKVYRELTGQNIECYLPLQKRLRKWKDRKKWVEMPLLPGYCFVYIDRKAYDQVLQTDNVVCYITFEGQAAQISQSQINALRQMLRQSDFEVNVSHENFEPGQRVEIIEGSLIGMQGELVKCKNKNKFILRIEQIKTVFSVEITADKITALPPKSPEE